jgi:hypothetical protein
MLDYTTQRLSDLLKLEISQIWSFKNKKENQMFKCSNQQGDLSAPFAYGA